MGLARALGVEQRRKKRQVGRLGGLEDKGRRRGRGDAPSPVQAAVHFAWLWLPPVRRERLVFGLRELGRCFMTASAVNLEKLGNRWV